MNFVPSSNLLQFAAGLGSTLMQIVERVLLFQDLLIAMIVLNIHAGLMALYVIKINWIRT